jgi:hypothetical protein
LLLVQYKGLFLFRTGSGCFISSTIAGYGFAKLWMVQRQIAPQEARALAAWTEGRFVFV